MCKVLFLFLQGLNPQCPTLSNIPSPRNLVLNVNLKNMRHMFNFNTWNHVIMKVIQWKCKLRMAFMSFLPLPPPRWSSGHSPVGPLSGLPPCSPACCHSLVLTVLPRWHLGFLSVAPKFSLSVSTPSPQLYSTTASLKNPVFCHLTPAASAPSLLERPQLSSPGRQDSSLPQSSWIIKYINDEEHSSDGGRRDKTRKRKISL